MPKRKRDESKEDRWARKMKKYEEKLSRQGEKSSRRIIHSGDEEGAQNQGKCPFYIK